MSLPRFGRPVTSFAGGDWPACRCNAGLGSNVSTCDGPPFMNRKITRLARAGKCGCLGCQGITENRGCTAIGYTAGVRRVTRYEKPGIRQHSHQSQRSKSAADPRKQSPARQCWLWNERLDQSESMARYHCLACSGTSRFRYPQRNFNSTSL